MRGVIDLIDIDAMDPAASVLVTVRISPHAAKWLMHFTEGDPIHLSPDKQLLQRRTEPDTTKWR